MKNILVYGTVAILSFLGCVFFLSPAIIYSNSSVAGAHSSTQIINHLASSVTYANVVTPSEAAEIILPAQSTIRDTIGSTQFNEQIPSVLKSENKRASPRTANTLLSTPRIEISGDMLLSDSSDTFNENPNHAVSTAVITREQETGTDFMSSSVLAVYTKALKKLANQNNYSTETAFLINLGMKSGRKRFFVINLHTGEVITSGLVAHGQGKKGFNLNKSYSNAPGSRCSSLGIYRVGGSYYGGYGKSFRLIGLSNTNSNAYRRAIVLHAMNCIPDQEINYPICQSEGCPSLSPKFLQELSPMIHQSKKPILLWIIDPAIDAGTDQ